MPLPQGLTGTGVGTGIGVGVGVGIGTFIGAGLGNWAMQHRVWRVAEHRQQHNNAQGQCQHGLCVSCVWLAFFVV